MPVLVRRARGRAEPRARPGRGADPPGARGQRPGPGRRGRAASAVRGLGRPGGAGAVQRLRGPAGVRPDLGVAGTPLAVRGPVRRAARARAGHAEPVDARGALRAHPGRRDVPHRDHPVPGDGRGAGGAPGGTGEDHRPDRGVRFGPPGPGGAPRRGRLGDPQRGRRGQVRPRGTAAGLAGTGRFGRLPGPVHRIAQGLPDPAQRAVPAGTGPARPAPAGRRAGRSGRGGGRPGPRRPRPDHLPRYRVRAGQGPDAAQRRSLCRAEHRWRVVRDDPDRGHGCGYPRGGQ